MSSPFAARGGVCMRSRSTGDLSDRREGLARRTDRIGPIRVVRELLLSAGLDERSAVLLDAVFVARGLTCVLSARDRHHEIPARFPRVRIIARCVNDVGAPGGFV